MTIETINTIEPKDIAAIEFSCKACGTKTIRKVDDRFTVPIICGNCPNMWFIADSKEVQDLREFVRMLECYGKNEAKAKYVLCCWVGSTWPKPKARGGTEKLHQKDTLPHKLLVRRDRLC